MVDPGSELGEDGRMLLAMVVSFFGVGLFWMLWDGPRTKIPPR